MRVGRDQRAVDALRCCSIERQGLVVLLLLKTDLAAQEARCISELVVLIICYELLESLVGLWNAYADLGTYWCFTLYVGAGIGIASVSVLGLKDVNVPNGGVAYGADNSETNFAWAAYGGIA